MRNMTFRMCSDVIRLRGLDWMGMGIIMEMLKVMFGCTYAIIVGNSTFFLSKMFASNISFLINIYFYYLIEK
jgi:hypothetical protein